MVSSFSFHLFLSASGPAAVPGMWHCGETHRCHCVGGLHPPGLRSLFWLVHLLLPRTPGIQPAVGQPDRVLQHILKWPAAGGWACQSSYEKIWHELKSIYTHTVNSWRQFMHQSCINNMYYCFCSFAQLQTIHRVVDISSQKYQISSFDNW